MKIITNNQERPIIYAYQLTEKELVDFDYIEDINSPDCSASFFRYKGELYDLGEFFTTNELQDSELKKWHGYQSESYFSGILIKYSDDFEHVTVGRYLE